MGDDELSIVNLNLPEAVVKKYYDNGITHMFSWQAECLSLPEIFEGKNLIYSAPTSAGKTLVAEVILLKSILERSKKGIYILPFVSVAREKTFSLQNLFGCVGISVEGFMGSHSPPGGLQRTDIAICTIEKANNILNRLIESGQINDVGIIVVDELHMVGDSSRGYLLELLLTKLQYLVTSKQSNSKIQIIGMSATLPNLHILSKWQKAELFKTDFRPIPLSQMAKIGHVLYSQNLDVIKDLRASDLTVKNDDDDLVKLCLETILDGFSVVIFCPTKAWCEKIALSVASHFFSIGKESSTYPQNMKDKLRARLDGASLCRLIETLKKCPAGLDSVLEKSLAFGTAFHHAGLTYDERDIIEAAFRTGLVPVLVATSTLSSGVNLPARRVIIRSPNSGGHVMDVLVYKQMIGRAGRKGKDTQGESILMCGENERHKVEHLMNSDLPPIESCLQTGTSLASSVKRAILEIVAGGVAKTSQEICLYWSCTLMAYTCRAMVAEECGKSGMEGSERCSKGSEYKIEENGKNQSELEGKNDTSKLIAEAEIVEKDKYENERSSLSSINSNNESNGKLKLEERESGNKMDETIEKESKADLELNHMPIVEETITFLLENELVRFIENDSNDTSLAPTKLGTAIMASGLSPDEGLHVFSELERARRCFVLVNELHLVYQVTPIYVSSAWPNLNWLRYLELWESLSPDMRKVGELVGVKESFIIRALKGVVNAKIPKERDLLSIHRRFYASLALHELIHEKPLNEVVHKFQATKGLLQALQHSASTFSGMVTVFCNRLGWRNMELLISQYQHRLQFGIERDLCDLVQISLLNGRRARLLHTAGLKNVNQLAHSSYECVEEILLKSTPFQSRKNEKIDNTEIIFSPTGSPLTMGQAASLIVNEARSIVEKEIGVENIQWGNGENSDQVDRKSNVGKRRGKIIESMLKFNKIEEENCGTDRVQVERDTVEENLIKNGKNIDEVAGNCTKENNLIQSDKNGREVENRLDVNEYEAKIDNIAEIASDIDGEGEIFIEEKNIKMSERENSVEQSDKTESVQRPYYSPEYNDDLSVKNVLNLHNKRRRSVSYSLKTVKKKRPNHGTLAIIDHCNADNIKTERLLDSTLSQEVCDSLPKDVKVVDTAKNPNIITSSQLSQEFKENILPSNLKNFTSTDTILNFTSNVHTIACSELDKKDTDTNLGISTDISSGKRVRTSDSGEKFTTSEFGLSESFENFEDRLFHVSKNISNVNFDDPTNEDRENFKKFTSSNEKIALDYENLEKSENYSMSETLKAAFLESFREEWMLNVSKNSGDSKHSDKILKNLENFSNHTKRDRTSILSDDLFMPVEDDRISDSEGNNDQLIENSNYENNRVDSDYNFDNNSFEFKDVKNQFKTSAKSSFISAKQEYFNRGNSPSEPSLKARKYLSKHFLNSNNLSKDCLGFKNMSKNCHQNFTPKSIKSRKSRISKTPLYPVRDVDLELSSINDSSLFELSTINDSSVFNKTSTPINLNENVNLKSSSFRSPTNSKENVNLENSSLFSSKLRDDLDKFSNVDSFKDVSLCKPTYKLNDSKVCKSQETEDDPVINLGINFESSKIVNSLKSNIPIEDAILLAEMRNVGCTKDEFDKQVNEVGKSTFETQFFDNKQSMCKEKVLGLNISSSISPVRNLKIENLEENILSLPENVRSNEMDDLRALEQDVLDEFLSNSSTALKSRNNLKISSNASSNIKLKINAKTKTLRSVNSTSGKNYVDDFSTLNVTPGIADVLDREYSLIEDKVTSKETDGLDSPLLFRNINSNNSLDKKLNSLTANKLSDSSNKSLNKSLAKLKKANTSAAVNKSFKSKFRKGESMASIKLRDRNRKKSMVRDIQQEIESVGKSKNDSSNTDKAKLETNNEVRSSKNRTNVLANSQSSFDNAFDRRPGTSTLTRFTTNKNDERHLSNHFRDFDIPVLNSKRKKVVGRKLKRTSGGKIKRRNSDGKFKLKEKSSLKVYKSEDVQFSDTLELEKVSETKSYDTLKTGESGKGKLSNESCKMERNKMVERNLKSPEMLKESHESKNHCSKQQNSAIKLKDFTKTIETNTKKEVSVQNTIKTEINARAELSEKVESVKAKNYPKNEELDETMKIFHELQTSHDTSSLNSTNSLCIIDVASDKKLFDVFIQEWKSKNKFCLNLAYEKSVLKNKPGKKCNVGLRKTRASAREDLNSLKSVCQNDLQLIGLSVCWGQTDSYYVDLQDVRKTSSCLEFETKVSLENRLSSIKSVFSSSHFTVIMLNVKKNIKIMHKFELETSNCKFLDPKVASWLLDPDASEKTLKELVVDFLPDFSNLLVNLTDNRVKKNSSKEYSIENGSNRASCLKPKGSLRVVAATESVLVYNLANMLQKKLENDNLIEIWNNVEMPMMHILAFMELNGVGFKKTELYKIKNVLEEKINHIETEAYKIVGRKFLFSSPAEVSKILYQDLQLGESAKVKNSTKSKYLKLGSTNKETLNRIIDVHPLPKIILEWRKIKGALNKVVYPLTEKCTGNSDLLLGSRIYSKTYTFTSTGRISFFEPNLQNIPRDFSIEIDSNDAGKTASNRLDQSRVMSQFSSFLEPVDEGTKYNISLRHAIVAASGRVLLSADYSQLELRILAHLSGDVPLSNALKSGKDVFIFIASTIHKISEKSVTNCMRQDAKQICYGIIYGMSIKRLSDELSVSEESARDFMENFHKEFPSIKKFIKSSVDEANKFTYTSTLSGRRRYLPGLKTRSSSERGHSERQAVNTRIQGTAADIVKTAMIKINQNLGEAFPDSPNSLQIPDRQNKLPDRSVYSGAYLVLQIHDELMYEVFEQDIIQVAQIVKSNMETAAPGGLELPVNLKIGPTWGSLQKFNL